MSLLRTEIKPFAVDAYHNGAFKTVSDADLKPSSRCSRLSPTQMMVLRPAFRAARARLFTVWSVSALKPSAALSTCFQICRSSRSSKMSVQ